RGGALADAAMRARDQRDERSEPAAQAEHGVPLQPRWTAQHEIAEGPADMADDPQHHAEEEGVPEEPLHPRPLGAAAQDDHADRDRGDERADVTVDRLRERVPAEEQPSRR